jgi:hypothetical protein
MDEANRLIGGHGVEAIRIEGAHVDNYHFDIVATYVNMGDPYVATLLHESETGRFLLTTWGDWVEANERNYLPEEEEDLEVTVWNAQASTALPDTPGAVDLDVDVGPFTGEVTMVSGRDGYEPYGNSPDHWISGGLLRALQGLSDEKFREVLNEIAGAASTEADRWARDEGVSEVARRNPTPRRRR